MISTVPGDRAGGHHPFRVIGRRAARGPRWPHPAKATCGTRPKAGLTDGKPFQPQVHYFVGGATKMYGAALYRLRPADFGEIQHSGGLSPAWPLSYDDFEPWYTKAEWLYQVHGARDEGPTEGPASGRYPWPAVSPDAEIIAVRPVLARPDVTLLASASDRHPAGLGNGSGQVGRNYMFHNSKAVTALGKERNDTVYQKTLGLNDFYLAGNGRPPLGNIQMLGKSNAMAMKGEEPRLTRLAPRWSLAEVARHAVDFWLTTEDVPKPGNRITIDSGGGIHLAYRQTNDAEAGAEIPRHG